MNGSADPMGNVHSLLMSNYDRTVTVIERNVIMSSEDTGTFAPSERPTKASARVKPVAKKKQPSIENIDVNALQIDETFDGDFDPYNSTGQFLADAIKKKYDDQ